MNGVKTSKDLFHRSPHTTGAFRRMFNDLQGALNLSGQHPEPLDEPAHAAALDRTLQRLEKSTLEWLNAVLKP